MLKRQACAKFQSQILDESEVIQILKVVRWHFCQVYISSRDLKTYNFSLVLRTRENFEVFNSLDEIYLVFTSKK